MSVDRRHRLPRLWSNTVLRDWAALCHGRVVNVSAGRDEDKQGGCYRDYFLNASEYVITNHAPGTFRGFSGVEGEVLLDLERPLPTALEGQFDTVFNHTTLEHVFDFRLATANLCAMSRDLVILVVPCAQVQHDHADFGDYWRFMPAGVRRLLGENQMEVVFEASNPDCNAGVYLFVVGSRFPERWRPACENFRPLVDVASQIGAPTFLSRFVERLRHRFARR
jgi:hypothetical protein